MKLWKEWKEGTAADRLILLWLIGTPVVFFGGLLAIIFLLPKGTPAPWYW